MRKRFFVLLLTAAVVPGHGAFAQAAPQTEQVDQAASADTGQTAPASTTVRMRGTIDRYNASTRMLSVSTPNGIAQFLIVSTARIRQRRDRIDAMKLETLAGYGVAIRYSESGGDKIVESVQVFGKDERTKR